MPVLWVLAVIAPEGRACANWASYVHRQGSSKYIPQYFNVCACSMFCIALINDVTFWLK
jgi:hypothetical protein